MRKIKRPGFIQPGDEAVAGANTWLVSCADKRHNARAIFTDLRQIGASVFEHFTAGRDGTLWYYGDVASAFARLLPGGIVRRTWAYRERDGGACIVPEDGNAVPHKVTIGTSESRIIIALPQTK